MIVKLLHYTPLWVASKAIRKCWASEGKSDTFFIEGEAHHIGNVVHGGDDVECFGLGQKDRELISRVANKNKHSSTIEHLNYTFDIEGISRACLQELARHRHASLSVKSTRYTLKELKDAKDLYQFIVLTENKVIDEAQVDQLESVKEALRFGESNDIVKYLLPEAYKTSLLWTINARSLQNFLSLRTNKAALWEIRKLAYNIYGSLPKEHKYLFKEHIKEREHVSK